MFYPARQVPGQTLWAWQQRFVLPRGAREYHRLVARNTGSGTRRGAIKLRVQALNPVTKRYVKIDTATGRIVDNKKTAGPYKGVREVKASRSKS